MTSSITIDNKEFKADQEICDLLQIVSEERDDLKEKLFRAEFDAIHKQDEYYFYWS